MWVEKYFDLNVSVFLIRTVIFNGVLCKRLKNHFESLLIKNFTAGRHKLFVTNEAEGNYRIEIYYNKVNTPIVISGNFQNDKNQNTSESYFLKKTNQFSI